MELTQSTQQQICMSCSLLQDVLHPGAPRDDTEVRIPHDLTPVFFQGKLRACTSILWDQAAPAVGHRAALSDFVLCTYP